MFIRVHVNMIRVLQNTVSPMFFALSKVAKPLRGTLRIPTVSLLFQYRIHRIDTYNQDATGFIRFHWNDSQVLQNTVILIAFCVFGNWQSRLAAISESVLHCGSQIHKNSTGVTRFQFDDFPVL